MTTPILITIPFSHFCEKARWALDHARVPYREEPHFPGAHRRATARYSGRSVPVLVTDGGVLYESSDILRYADERAPNDKQIFPSDHRAEIDGLIQRFDRQLGPATRLIVYHHLLPDPARLIRCVGGSYGRRDRWLVRVVLPLMRPIMRRGMKITSENASRSVEIVRRCFSDMSAQLSGGFLVGGRFTAADLTFAAFGAAAVLPVGHAHYTSDLSILPNALRPLAEELRATPAGAHVQAMYANLRRES